MRSKQFEKYTWYLFTAILLLFFLNYAQTVFILQFKKNKSNVHFEKAVLSDCGYLKVSEIINWNSGFNSYIQLKNGKNFNVLFEDEKIYSTRNNTLEDITKITNTSYKVSFYSLSFVRDALITGQIDRMSYSQINQLNGIILKVIDISKKIPLREVFIFNDQAVAERIEVLMLYSAYIKEKNDDKSLLTQLEGHIKHLSTLLENNDFFMYNTNHGLMQLRALLSYYAISGETSSLNDVIEKIKEIYPIYFAKDGSILESSSGYQIYIFNQFQIMNRLIKLLSDKHNFLDDEIYLQQCFIGSQISKDGFLQGTGNSYSKYINTLNYPPVKENIVYNYLNGTAGINAYSNDDEVFSLMFVSLDNKPNVHKLPEDLSIYLYYNEPFFVNTGTYSYETNDENRKFILSNSSQNGVHFEKTPHIIGSDIEIKEFIPNKKVTFRGNSFSKDSDSISRILQVNLLNSKIEIEDSSERKIESRFIVHPDVGLNVIDEYVIELIGKKGNMLFKSFSPIYIRDSWISDTYQNKKDVKMLIVEGKKNSLEITNPNPYSIKIDQVIDKCDELTEREHITKKLRLKYSRTFNNIIKINRSYIVLFSVILSTFFFMMFLSKRWIIGICACWLIYLILEILLSQLLTVKLVYYMRSILLNLL